MDVVAGITEIKNPASPNLLAEIKDNAEEAYETAKEHFIATFLLLVSFLQQLSLIQVDGIELNLWGDVFAFLKVLSLNVDLEFGEEEQDVAILSSAVAAPLFLLAIFSAELETRGIAQSMQNYRKPVLVTQSFGVVTAIGVLSMIAGVVVYFVVDTLVGTAIVVLSGYVFLYQLYLSLVYIYFRISDKEFLLFQENYEAFKNYERQLLVGVWISSIAVIGSIVFETAILNENKTIQLIFSIIGCFSLFYMILFLAFMAKVSTTELNSDQLTTLVKRLFCFSSSNFENKGGMITELGDENPVFVSRHKFALFDKLIPYLKNEHWYYLFMLSIEKLILVFAQSILVTLIDPEFTALVDLITLVLFFILVIVTNPYKEKLNNIAEKTSRFSNLMLLFSSFLLTIFPDDDNLEQGLNVIMLTISALTAVFWFYILYKLNVITQMLRSVADRFTFIKAYFEKRALLSVLTYEQFEAKIKNYKNQEIPSWLWNKLSPNEKLLTIIVPRGEPTEQAPFGGDGVTLNISPYAFTINGEDFSEGFRKYGIAYSRDYQSINLSTYAFSEKLCQYLIASRFFAVDHLTRGINFNNTSATNLNLFFEALSLNTVYQQLSFTTFRLRSSDTDIVCDYLSKAIQLKKFHLSGNLLTDEDGVKLIEALRKHEMDELNIQNNDFGEKTYSKIGKVLEEDTDHVFCKRIILSRGPQDSKISDEVYYPIQQLVHLRRRECPELSVGDFTGNKTSCYMEIDDKAIGFSRDVWYFLTKGVNTLMLPTLLMLTEEEKEACAQFINYRWEDVWVKRAHGKLSNFVEETLGMKGHQASAMQQFYLELGLGRETVTEVVLRKGMSHVAETLELLIEFGADLSLETADGSKTLKDLAAEHEDEEVKKIVA